MKKLKQKYRNSKTTGCPTKTFGHDRQCGFTLVELVITIAIVIILSVISVPIYRAYVDKSKMAEGYALIGAVISAQKAYFSEYGNFYNSASVSLSADRWTSFNTALGVDARGNKYFTSFSSGWAPLDAPHISTAFMCEAVKPVEIQEPNKQVLEVYFYTNSGATVRESKKH